MTAPSDVPAASAAPAAGAPAGAGGGKRPRASLKRRSLTASAWSAGGMMAGRLVSLASNLTMTRLLAPEAFGLMAMAITVLTFVEMAADIGIRQSVVRDARGEETHFLRVAWTVQILRSAVLAIAVLAAAALLWPLGPALSPPDSVYADPRLPLLVAATAGLMFLKGFASTAAMRAERRLEVGRLALTTLGGQVVGVAAMIAFAFGLGWEVWALMAGAAIATAATTLLTHALFPDLRMGFAWDRGIAAELWRFGRWIIGGSIAGFVVNNADRIILGALMAKDTFGLYAIAVIWLQAGLAVLRAMAGRILMGAQAEVSRERRHELPRVMRRLRHGYDACLAAAFLVALFGAEPFVRLLYTPEYQGAAAFLALLSLRALAMRQQPIQAFLLVEGRSDVTAGATALAALAATAAIPLAWYLLDLRAAVLAGAIAPLVGTAVLVRAARRQMPGLPVERDVALAWLIAALAAAIYAVGPRFGI